MKNKVQTIEYVQEPGFPLNYIAKDSENPDIHYKKIRLSEAKTSNIGVLDPNFVLEYATGLRWKHLSAMWKIKRYKDIFCGSINLNTSAIWIHPDKSSLALAIFHGHQPKYDKARERKVLQFISSRK